MITSFHPPFMARLRFKKHLLMPMLVNIYPTIRCGPERGQCGMVRAPYSCHHVDELEQNRRP
jgi:hypothetical protein